MINRNNYEEYFLMMADKELSPSDEAMVKAFAAQHPDLQEELDIILSCCLDAEPAPVFPKEKLLRTTIWSEEQPEPIHTQMLLLLDNELNATEAQQLQSKIKASAPLQTEWNTLQQTKLVAEAVAHPDKESLYRKERKVRPLVWMRWAAAAAVIVAIGTLIWSKNPAVPTGTTETVASVSTNPPADKSVTAATQSPQTNTTQPDENVAVASNKEIETTAAVKENPQQTAQPKASEEDQFSDSHRQKAFEKYATNDTYAATVAEDQTANLQVATISDLNTDTDPLTSQHDLSVQTAHISPKPIAITTVAAVQKTEAFTGSKVLDNNDDEEYISIGGARIRKQKMRGLLRNVTRSVSRSFSKSKIEPDVYASR